MHRAAFAFAVAGLFAEQLCEHPVEFGAFGHTVSMTTMRTRDVVVRPEGFADADGDGFLADVQMSQTRHQSAGIKVVYRLFKEPDHDHATIHMKPLFGFNSR